MQLAKVKNVNPFVMLFVITGFQLICFLTLITSVAEEFRTGVLISFGGYLLVEYAYFIGTAVILKRRAFEVELIAFLLTSIGLSITASVYPDGILKQFIAVVIGIAGFVLLQVFMRDLKLCIAVRVPIAVIAVGLLAFTLVFASVTNGAKNWVYLGGISIQPSELVKVAFIFVGSATLEKLQSNKSLTKFIVFALGCVGMLFLMYDFGTALIFFFTFIVISFMRSGDVRTIALVCTVALMGGLLVLIFRPYVANRFAAYGHVWEYFDSSGYQQTRTMIYSASGGLFGVGLGNGKLRDIFAATEDLVFGVVCEEFDRFQFSQGLENLFKFIRELNRYIENKAPWKLAKSQDEASKKELADTLAFLMEGIRLSVQLLQVIIPESSSKLMAALNLAPNANDFKWNAKYLAGTKLSEKFLNIKDNRKEGYTLWNSKLISKR